MSVLAWIVAATALASPSADRVESTAASEQPKAEPMRGSASLRGSVVFDSEDVALGEILIELECACLGTIERVRVDLAGGFSYAGLPDGAYLVRARYPGGLAEQPVTLIAGRPVSIVMRLSPPTPLPEPPPPVLPARPAGDVLAHPVDQGAALRRYGLGFTVIGAVLGIGALVAAYHNPCGKDGAQGANCRTDVRNAVGLLMGVTALGSMTGGIISMSVGQALRRRGQLEAGLAWQIGPEGGGLTVSGRF